MKGDMTVREAGRRGGTENSNRHDHAHFVELGQRGGKTTSDRHGHEFYERIGKLGGAKLRELVQAGRDALGTG